MNRLLLAAALLVAPGLAQAQSWQWVTAATGPGNARIYATATDAAGGTVVAGDFTGTITLGSTTLTSAGEQDAFVARLNSAGAFTQAARAGGPGQDYAKDLVLDASGNVTVLGGFFSSTAQFGSTTLTKAGSAIVSEIFVAQLSSSGTWTRAVQGGSLGTNFPSALQVDAAGNAVVTGLFYRPSTTFGATTLTNSDPNGYLSDVFVARLSSAGVWTQAVRAGSAGSDYANDLALDADGSALVVGYFEGPTMTLGSFSLANADTRGGQSDLFVARLSSAGTWTQAVRAGGALSDRAKRVVIDAAGTATVVGSFYSPAISFGTFNLTNASPTSNSSDVFVARFTPSGTWSLAVRAGGAGHDNALAVAIGANGQTTVGGEFTSPTALFGSLSLTNSNTYGTTNDLFVARLNGEGTAWTHAVRAGGGLATAVSDLALTTSGEATITGMYLLSTIIGTTRLSATVNDADTGFIACTSGLALGVRQAAGVAPLAVYPNPTAAGTAATLRLSAAAPTVQTLVLRDALGRIVRQATIGAGKQEVQLPTTGLSPGVYLLEAGLSRTQLVVE